MSDFERIRDRPLDADSMRVIAQALEAHAQELFEAYEGVEDIDPRERREMGADRLNADNLTVFFGEWSQQLESIGGVAQVVMTPETVELYFRSFD
jgi:hypothetical protein